MSSNTLENRTIQQELVEFLRGTQSLMLATVNQNGLPEASYAPYVQQDGCYYIFVSALASHTANLKYSGVASVLFTASHDDGHPHARKRLSCQCKASVIARQDALFEAIMQRMEQTFGKLIVTLRGLGDFQLIQLEPGQGNFVSGFGKAFDIDFPLGSEIRHKKP
jgi:putative heme iron utilization protein